jgi:NADH-quinone oxidoreductase subunit I
MKRWFANLFNTVFTLLNSLWVGMRYWIRTYDPSRRTYTEQYEYPELPAALRSRFRGFHRYDLKACIACERCARECPAGCISVGKQKASDRKGFQATSFTVDYTKCMLCGICTESCPTDCIHLGASYDLSCYSREGCVVDFARLPVEIASGAATLDALAVAQSKAIAQPVLGLSSSGDSSR